MCNIDCFFFGKKLGRSLCLQGLCCKLHLQVLFRSVGSTSAKMQALMRLKLRLPNSNFNPLFRLSSYSNPSPPPPPCSPPYSLPSPLPCSSAYSTATNLFTAPWSATQCRGIKVSASDVRFS